MNRFLSTHSRTIFTCLFGMAAILFFGYFCQYHLMYIEGMQLFLYTGEYFQETLIHPGGVADLFARFLTQFYHLPLVGGVIIALLLILFQAGIWSNVKNITATRKQSDWWLLTFIPPAAYWIGSSYHSRLGIFILFETAQNFIPGRICPYSDSLVMDCRGRRSSSSCPVNGLCRSPDETVQKMAPLFWYSSGNIVFLVHILHTSNSKRTSATFFWWAILQIP